MRREKREEEGEEEEEGERRERRGRSRREGGRKEGERRMSGRRRRRRGTGFFLVPGEKDIVGRGSFQGRCVSAGENVSTVMGSLPPECHRGGHRGPGGAGEPGLGRGPRGPQRLVCCLA